MQHRKRLELDTKQRRIECARDDRLHSSPYWEPWLFSHSCVAQIKLPRA